MPVIANISSYNPSSTDKLFFDANIWLNLLNPLGSKLPEIYKENISEFYRKVLNAKSRIYITSMILSEFFNAYARNEFKTYEKIKNKKLNYKRDFRDTYLFKNVIKDIQSLINDNILKDCIKLNDNFSSLNLNSINNNDDFTGYDYNDKFYSLLCESEDITIVTADKDFNKSCKAKVITLDYN